ncbi:hypothetical protein RRG08_054393 [Elysia crispata]|uniref:Uncharacterized protein n=1 Tax=Elysia crispata TaxID=231223 RepID=A0AAE1B475_9GAST|nr:hypothetical protein RRG08_054393 [Elysia crispata]
MLSATSAACTDVVRLQFILRMLLWVLVTEPAMSASNSSSTTNSNSESDGSMMKGLLAGLGGFVGLIVFICLLWCCCCSDDNSCQCSASCFGKKGPKIGHPYEDHGPGHDPARPPRHSRDKSKVSPSPPLQTGNLRAPSQWSHTR